MTEERWQAIERLFHACIEREPAERDALLEASCAGHASLRREVESLLALENDSSRYLKAAVGAGVRTLDDEAESWVGRQIGPYRLVREIGRGGMGTVYLAARTGEFQQQAAIKIIRRGIDTEAVVGRFRLERQILARLDHPHIARLLDGGSTAEGLPYFVMEYIDGSPITEHCAERAMPLRQRLELFRKVCDAVEYAHRNLIVHRDLKPGNVLVTREGAPKLLDFGIAKILEPGNEAQATTLFVHPMTPEWASPEQVRGEPVTTATDVYQLGLLLFELLTERRAYAAKPMRAGELERTICEEEAPKPSSVARQRLSGELDTIVGKALEKDPKRRYGSVFELSEDVRRYLEGLPIAARPSTLGYRFSKFVRRNRAVVAAASLVSVSLLGGMAGTLWEARVARHQQLRAERRFSDVKNLAHSFLFEFHNAIAQLPGATPARELVVRTALQYLESLAQESRQDPALQRELAEAYEKVGEIQGLPGVFNLGDTRGALASYSKATALREALVRADHANADFARELSNNYRQTGRVLQALGRFKEAIEMYRKAVEVVEKLEGPDPKDPRNLKILGAAYMDLGPALRAVAAGPGPLDACTKAVRLYEKVLAVENSPPNRMSLALAYKMLAGQQAVLGDHTAQLATIRKAVAIEEAVVRESPGNAKWRMDLAVSYGETGVALGNLKRYREAIGFHRKSLEIRQALAASDPKNARLRIALAFTHSRLAQVLLLAGDSAGAMTHARRALAICRAEVQADPRNAGNRTLLAISERVVGDVYAHAGRCGPALLHYRQAIKQFDEIKKSGSLSAIYADEAALAKQGPERCSGC